VYKPLVSSAPALSILNAQAFHYTSSAETDIRKTFARVQRGTALAPPGILVRPHSDPAAIRAAVVLRDGTAVQLRAIRPDDKERLRIAFERLSRRSVYRRFLHSVTALTPNTLRQLTELDFCDHVGLVLSTEDETGEQLIAVGRFVRVAPRSERAEFAITVADEYQNRGAGTLLLQRLVDIARARGVREFLAYVLEENREMLKVIRGTELPCRRTSEDGVRLVVMSLVDD
jgi:GNAT superfamily N-acetyltransferase